MTEAQNNAHQYFTKCGFLPIDKNSCQSLRKYDAGDNRFWELSATACINWGPQFHAVYKIIQNCHCSAWFYSDGKIYFYILRPEAGESFSFQMLVDDLYDLAINAGLPSLQIFCIEERLLPNYETVKGYAVKTEHHEDDGEYIYTPDSILELSGGVNANKRYILNKYFSMPEITFMPMTETNTSDCFIVEDAWCEHQDCDYCKSFAGCPKDSLKVMLDNFDKEHHHGLVGYIDGKPVGYAIWEIVNNIAFIQFAKSSLPNFNVYTYYTMVKQFLSKVEYLNVGQDMGMHGLRKFKRHLSAYSLLKKHLCTFTKAS